MWEGMKARSHRQEEGVNVACSATPRRESAVMDTLMDASVRTWLSHLLVKLWGWLKHGLWGHAARAGLPALPRISDEHLSLTPLAPQSSQW